MDSTSSTIVLAIATVTGPVVAVLITIWLQKRFQEQQNQWHEQVLKQIEAERQKWEFTRHDSESKFAEAWNIGFRDRFDKLNKNVEDIAEFYRKKM